MVFEYKRKDILNLEESLKCEWLETNGLGGYASSTIVGCHTRKYHGLLVVPIPELRNRFVLLSKVGVAVNVEGHVFNLSTNKFPGVFDPTGHKYIQKFHCHLCPQTQYNIGDIVLTKDLIMPQNKNLVIIKYELVSSEKPIKIQLHPRLAYRDIHSVTRNNMDLQVKTFVHDNNVYKVQPYDSMPPLYMDTSAVSVFYAGPYWMHNFEYLKERTRGFEYQEDLFCPGMIEYEMKQGDVLYFRAGIETPAEPAAELWKNEMNRRIKALESYKGDPLSIRVLKEKAEQFLITNSRQERSIVAGYHWFAEWGRDAMIALPGITLLSGHTECALGVLETFAKHEKQGLIPNYLNYLSDEHAYNSIDASFWFFWAVQAYHKVTADTASIRDKLFPIMKKIINSILDKVTPQCYLQENGLLWVGNEHTQLTWMDAKVNGKPVTPRHGMAVEINALWYNAMSYYKELCVLFQEEQDQRITDNLNRIQESFIQTFWNEEHHYLADVVNEKGKDFSIRPNQIFAVSLPYSLLNQEQKNGVVDCVTQHLATPYGLRSLSPRNVMYKMEYTGAPEQRDAAYHQGTVWSWLVGHYVEARLRVAHDYDKESCLLKKEFAPLWKDHLKIGCVGGISEIFNGDPPHTHKGAVHQAWSVGEVIRALHMLEKKELIP